MQNIDKSLRCAISIALMASSNLYASDEPDIFDEISFSKNNIINNNGNNNTLIPNTIETINNNNEPKLNEKINTVNNQFTTIQSTNNNTQQEPISIKTTNNNIHLIQQNAQRTDKTLQDLLAKMNQQVQEVSLNFNEKNSRIQELLKLIKDNQNIIMTSLDKTSNEIIDISKKLGTSEVEQNQINTALDNLTSRINHSKFQSTFNNEMITQKSSTETLSDNKANIEQYISNNRNINLNFPELNYGPSIGRSISKLQNSTMKNQLIQLNTNINNSLYKPYFNLKRDTKNEFQNINKKQIEIDNTIQNLNNFLYKINETSNAQLKNTADHNETIRYFQEKINILLESNNQNTLTSIPQFNINKDTVLPINNDIILQSANNIANNDVNKIQLLENSDIDNINSSVPVKDVLRNINIKFSLFDSNNNELDNKFNKLNQLINARNNKTINNLNSLKNNINKVFNKINSVSSYNKEHVLEIKRQQQFMCCLENEKGIRQTLTNKYQTLSKENIKLKNDNSVLHNSVHLWKSKYNNVVENRKKNSDSNIDNRERSRDRELSNAKKLRNNTNMNKKAITIEIHNKKQTINGAIRYESNNKNNKSLLQPKFIPNPKKVILDSEDENQ